MTTSAAAGPPGDRSSYWNDDFHPLYDAGKIILAKLRNDEQKGDLYRRIMSKTPANATTVATSGPGGASSRSNGTSNGGVAGGVGPAGSAADDAASEESNNYDPSHHYFPNGPVRHSKSIPLPPYLQDLLTTKLKVSTTMGLFPQAEMAWMTIDDTVYLWTYNASFVSSGNVGTGMSATYHPSNHFLEFQVPSRQPIISVGLAPPKPGESEGIHSMASLFLVSTGTQRHSRCRSK
jgi:Nup133 N terminal like